MSAEPDDNREFRKRLAAWLPTLDEEAARDALQIHLGDLHASCSHVLATLEKLPSLAHEDEPALRRTLADLKGEFYEHMVPHLKQLRPHLDSVILRRYREAEERGEL